MKFEIGKYYEHTSGKQIHILCETVTEAFGKCLMCESSGGIIYPVGLTEEYSANYKLISRERFLLSNFNFDKKTLKKLQRKEKINNIYYEHL